MSFDPITAGLDLGKQLVSTLGKWIPDVAQRDQAAAEIQGQVLTIVAAQVALNVKEAESPRFFVSGWRPATGWVCLGGLTYQAMVRPIVQSIINIWVPEYHMVTMELDTLLTLLFGMLGLGGYRTFEKYTGVTK